MRSHDKFTPRGIFAPRGKFAPRDKLMHINGALCWHYITEMLQAARCHMLQAARCHIL